MDQLPSAAAQALEAALGLLPEAALNQGIFQQAALFTRSAQLSLAGRYLNWLRFLPADWLKALMGDETEQRISDEFQAFFVPDTDLSEKNTFARLLDANLNFYIPHMMLPRLERTASFAGIDIRTPFLDHHLLQFVQDIPIHLKTRQRASRHILWRAVEDLLPRQVLDNRQKQTFSANADPWIKGELQAATAGMLLSDQARIRAYVNPEALKDLVTAGSNQSLGRAVWTLLSFEIWLQTYFG
jgi:asparagine synthase (glutamine-hydrolysing)